MYIKLSCHYAPETKWKSLQADTFYFIVLVFIYVLMCVVVVVA